MDTITIKRNGQTFEVHRNPAHFIRQVDDGYTARFIDTASYYGKRLFAQAEAERTREQANA